jgi:Zn-dependent M28 family amino/carboxypeptidase
MIKVLFALLCFMFLSACNSTSSSQDSKKSLLINIEPSQLLNHFQQLSSDTFQGRKVSSDGNLKAQQYIIKQLANISASPYKGKFKHSFQYSSGFKAKFGSNIIAEIKGNKDNLDYIVLTAHFDHLGKKGSKIFNGADDNASGTSALLSMAQQLVKQPLNHNVIILFTDAEESGLKGSKAFFEQNKALHSRIKLNINMDMLAGSRSSKKLHYIFHDLDKLLSKEDYEKFQHNHLYHELSIVKGFRKERYALNKRTNWLLASDHGVFYQNGVPFIYYGVGTHQNYHSQHDEFSNTNHKLLIHSTNAIYQQLLFLDQVI